MIESNKSEFYEPKTLFIHVGTNDLKKLKSTDDVMGRIKNVISVAKTSFPKSTIVVDSLIKRKDLHPSLIKRSNSDIRWLCSDMQVVYLDVNKYIDNSCLGRDGLHLNRKGSMILGRVMGKTALKISQICTAYDSYKKQEAVTQGSDVYSANKTGHSTTQLIVDSPSVSEINKLSTSTLNCSKNRRLSPQTVPGEMSYAEATSMSEISEILVESRVSGKSVPKNVMFEEDCTLKDSSFLDIMHVANSPQ